MQRITIVGNLTHDPESRQTNSGKTVCNFTVAVNRRQKKQDGTNEADFFRVNAWEQMGQACQTYLAKGKKVCVVGTVSVHAYTDKNGNAAASMDVFAQEVEFLSPNGQGGNAQPQQTESIPQSSETTFMPSEDELPF